MKQGVAKFCEIIVMKMLEQVEKNGTDILGINATL